MLVYNFFAWSSKTISLFIFLILFLLVISSSFSDWSSRWAIFMASWVPSPSCNASLVESALSISSMFRAVSGTWSWKKPSFVFLTLSSMLSSWPLHVLRNLCFLVLFYSSVFILYCLFSKSEEDDDSSAAPAAPVTGIVLFLEPVIIAFFIFTLCRLMLELSCEELRVMLLLTEALPRRTVSLATRAYANIFAFLRYAVYMQMRVTIAPTATSPAKPSVASPTVKSKSPTLKSSWSYHGPATTLSPSQFVLFASLTFKHKVLVSHTEVSIVEGTGVPPSTTTTVLLALS